MVSNPLMQIEPWKVRLELFTMLSTFRLRLESPSIRQPQQLLTLKMEAI
jgi:hypothetical protein